MKRKPASKKRLPVTGPPAPGPRPRQKRSAPATLAVAHDSAFQEVLGFIERARRRAFQAVNTELIDLYWRVGEFISLKIETAVWGQGVVAALAAYIQHRQPNLRGFTRASLFRMRQFFDAYRHDKKVAALLRQLPWTQNLLILARSKRPEEREFYLRLAIRERWSSRELKRQLDTALFERTILAPAKVSAALTPLHPAAGTLFKDCLLYTSPSPRD